MMKYSQDQWRLIFRRQGVTSLVNNMRLIIEHSVIPKSRFDGISIIDHSIEGLYTMPDVRYQIINIINPLEPRVAGDLVAGL